jgi:hypothetical protein
MAAKNKRTKRTSASGNEITDIRGLFALHTDGSRRFDELISEGLELQAMGKIGEARQRLKAAQEMQQRLRALEDECRLIPDKTTDSHSDESN